MARRLEGDDRETLPVVEERAVVRKRKKLTGGVRARTVVHEDEEVIREALRSEEVEVEQEVIVVEKRLKAIEEVRLTKRQTTRNADERVALRREKVILERLDAADEDGPA